MGNPLRRTSWEDDPESRREHLMTSIEASGISTADHLQELTLEQLEDIYKMAGHYDKKHYHSNESLFFGSLWKYWDWE